MPESPDFEAIAVTETCRYHRGRDYAACHYCGKPLTAHRMTEVVAFPPGSDGQPMGDPNAARAGRR